MKISIDKIDNQDFQYIFELKIYDNVVESLSFKLDESREDVLNYLKDKYLKYSNVTFILDLTNSYNYYQLLQFANQAN